MLLRDTASCINLRLTGCTRAASQPARAPAQEKQPEQKLSVDEGPTEKKKTRGGSAYHTFVRENIKKHGGDMKAVAAAYRQQKGGGEHVKGSGEHMEGGKHDVEQQERDVTSGGYEKITRVEYWQITAE